MEYPSLMMWVLGGGITAILNLVNWYIWRSMPVLPYPLTETSPDIHSEHLLAVRQVA